MSIKEDMYNRKMIIDLLRDREDLIVSSVFNHTYEDVKFVYERKEWNDPRFRDLLMPYIWRRSPKEVVDILTLPEWDNPKYSKLLVHNIWLYPSDVIIEKIRLSYFEGDKYNRLLTSALINTTIKNIVGTRIDTLNIIWILRAKKYYSLSNEELENLLIPIYYNLRKSNIEELIDANSFDEIQTILSKTIYKKFANSTEESIEKDIKIYLKHQYEKILSQNKFDLSFVFSYIYLSEYQKINVVHILGGIYYHLDKNKIESDLII